MQHYFVEHQKGVSLIEALVALLILALGIMGLAGIQTQTLVDSRSSNYRAVAVQAAEDLLERMQANSQVRITNPAPNPYVVAFGSTPANPNCFANDCNGIQLANFDLWQWKTALGALLPGGDARVFRSTTDPSQFGVLVAWNETLSKNQATASAGDLALYTQTLAISSGVAGADCPADRTCHLVYIRP
jgi:type IV pilus assembly protein PilV